MKKYLIFLVMILIVASSGLGQSVFLKDNVYKESKKSAFLKTIADSLKPLVEKALTDKTLIISVKGEATKSEKFRWGDKHRRLFNRSVASYRADQIVNWIEKKYPKLTNRIEIKTPNAESKRRGVYISLRVNNTAKNIMNLASILIKTRKEVKRQAKVDSIHDKKFSQIENRLDELEKGSDFYRLEVGNGLMAVKYSHISWKATPSLKIAWNLNNYLGLQAEGGVVPVDNYNDESTWDAICNSAFFVKPISWLKVLAGYSLSANFYEKDFAWAESRDDAFLMGAELNFQMSKKVKIYFSSSWVRSDFNGALTSFGVSYSFWN